MLVRVKSPGEENILWDSNKILSRKGTSSFWVEAPGVPKGVKVSSSK